MGNYSVIRHKNTAIFTQNLSRHKTALLLEDKKPFAQQLKDLGFIPNVYSPDYSLVNTAARTTMS